MSFSLGRHPVTLDAVYLLYKTTPLYKDLDDAA